MAGEDPYESATTSLTAPLLPETRLREPAGPSVTVSWVEFRQLDYATPGPLPILDDIEALAAVRVPPCGAVGLAESAC
jgi:hypothetical protein